MMIKMQSKDGKTVDTFHPIDARAMMAQGWKVLDGGPYGETVQKASPEPEVEESTQTEVVDASEEVGGGDATIAGTASGTKKSGSSTKK